MPSEVAEKDESQYRRELEAQVERKYKEYYWGCMGWSFRFHFCLFGSVVASALAASWLQFDAFKGPHQNDIAAGLAVLAAVMTGVMGAGRLSGKWRANRLSRSLTERLKIDLLNPAADLEKIRAGLKDIIRRHDEAILGPDDGGR